MISDKRIILCSASPRRQELLGELGYDFILDTETSFVEHFDAGTPLEQVPAIMSEGKSKGFHRPLEDNEILLTSDTMVYCRDRIMGKPAGKAEAVEMLEFLSGKVHHVTTAITLRSNARTATLSDTAYVHFKQLTEKEIEYYVDNFRPFDKAGAYGIQEWIGYVGIDKIEGSFYTIMGLPVHLVYQELNSGLY